MFCMYREFHISHSMARWCCQRHIETALVTAVKGIWEATDTVQKNLGFIRPLFVEQLFLFGRNYSWSLKYLIDIVTVYPHYLS